MSLLPKFENVEEAADYLFYNLRCGNKDGDTDEAIIQTIAADIIENPSAYKTEFAIYEKYQEIETENLYAMADMYRKIDKGE